MPTLFQWSLTLWHGVPLGIGIVSGHRRLKEGMDIHTSPILHAAREETGIQLETASGSIYHLQMKEWNPYTRDEDPLAPELLGLPADFLKQCARAREEASLLEKADLRLSMKPGALFMRTVGTHILSALWSGADAQIRDAQVGIHLGMFQDSYLVCGAYEEASTLRGVDLRFFSIEDRLEPYHVSPGLELLLIRNEGCTDIAFGFSQKNMICPPGMTTYVPIQSSIV